jgi:hypothetical protein
MSWRFKASRTEYAGGTINFKLGHSANGGPFLKEPQGSLRACSIAFDRRLRLNTPFDLGAWIRILGVAVLSAALVDCAASKQEVATRLGDQYVGQNADALVMKFGPPASTFKMNSGDTSYIWQLGNQTNIVADRGTGVATTQFCKNSVIANKNGIITQLSTEHSNAGGGLYALTGALGSICANRLGIERQS